MFGLPRIRKGVVLLAVLAVMIIPVTEISARDSQESLAEAQRQAADRGGCDGADVLHQS
jgi:ABC-type phosphate transport system permease subunit